MASGVVSNLRTHRAKYPLCPNLFAINLVIDIIAPFGNALL